MGLLDILNGMQNGPRGQRQPAPAPAAGGGGMSPLMMALLGLLAYKAIKGGGLENMLGGGSKGKTASGDAAPPTSPAAPGGGLGDILGNVLGGGRAPAPGVGRSAAPGGGLGDLLGAGALGGASGGLGGILGGLLAGGAAGPALNGGLRNLVQDMEESGQGEVAQSWVGRGTNRAISPGDLAGALGADTIDRLSDETGMPRDELLSGLSQQLPDLVDQLTPDGRLPTDQEAARWV
jgi:uncharacterized protein YidB (DUF937 family)